MLDTTPQIHVSGVGNGAVVRASAVDAGRRRWTSTTRVADLRRDPTRPLWTLRRHGSGVFVAPQRGFELKLDLVDGGRSVARTTMTRLAVAPGVRRRRVRNGLYGDVFSLPRPRPQPAALAIGGSEGGLATGDIAGLLASRGFTSMALAYFQAPGLPRALRGIPLEYFARALRHLRRRADVDPRRIVVIGVSRGGEGALLIGATYPRQRGPPASSAALRSPTRRRR